MIGTKLVSEGIDIKSVKLVLLVDYLPTVGEYIQTAGRLREGGVCMSFWTKRCVGKFSIKPDVCIAKQTARFYGLSHLGHDLCCSHLHGIPDDVSHLYRYLKGEVGPRVEEVGSSLGDGIGDSNANSEDNSLSFGNESSVFEVL
ncbi:hypothetical protein NCAS_0H03670 [Naumovozyma castellii]|uniref:Helicase C-terminal domain-containing protein n=1 Tax=Naumovozyma castellii TaxID=27288 RepID=G0VJJ7_NAUCA|nr:hypothetical protein NCAS_0H03670 [Naumovozyma castellii CBS 4309]CCC71677.1 hypothetical protein NCAS_0H03670 [Naumovozyma castellii CBS 4309]